MVVAAQASRISYQGNGVTTVFPFPFKALSADHVAVYVREEKSLAATLVAPGLYDITLLAEGGTVTYSLSGRPLTTEQEIFILRAMPYEQPILLQNQTRYFPDVVMEGFDRLAMQIQQLEEQLDRKIGIDFIAGGIDEVVPQEFGYLAFDANKQPYVTGPLPDLSTVNDILTGQLTEHVSTYSGDGTNTALALALSVSSPAAVLVTVAITLGEVAVLRPGIDYTVAGQALSLLAGGDLDVWPEGEDNITVRIRRQLDLAAITADDVTLDDRPLSEVLAGITSVSQMDLGAWLARYAPTDWVFASQGVTAGQNAATLTAAVQAFWAEVVNRGIVQPGFVHVILPAANILLSDEMISEATAQLIWDNTPNGRSDRGIYVEDRGLQVDIAADFPAQRVRTSGLYAEQSIPYAVPSYVFRWEQSGGAVVLRRWTGKTKIIGNNSAANDPGGIRLFRINGLMAPDGFVDIERMRRHTPVDIDQCQNMRWGQVEVSARTGWQPTEVGAGSGHLSGTVRFNVLGTTVEATEDVFKAEDVGKWFCVDRCGPEQANEGEDEDAGDLSNFRIAWWSQITGYISPTQVTWASAPPANVSGMTGSFAALRFTSTAGSTAITLSAPVETSLVGCQIIPYGAGIQSVGIGAGLAVPLTVTAHTGASITVSHVPLRSVTDGPLVVSPQMRLIQTSEGLQRAEVKRPDDLWFRDIWLENGGTGGQSTVPMVIGRGEGIWISGKLHGASPRVQNNFGGNFANLIVGRVDVSLEIQSSHGMNSPFFGKVMASGDKVHLKIEGVASAWTAPTHAAEFYLAPDAPEFTEFFKVYDGQHSRASGFPNTSVGQVFVRGGTHFRSGLTNAIGSAQPALGQLPMFPDHEFAGTVAHAYGSELSRLAAACAAGWRGEDGLTYAAGPILFTAVSGSTLLPLYPGLEPSGQWTPLHFGAVGDGVTDDGAAFNLALAAYKTEIEASPNRGSAATFDGLGLTYRTTISLNATGITGWNWKLTNFSIIGECAGKSVLDMVGSRGGALINVHIWGDETDMPTNGMQSARSGTGEDAFGNGLYVNNVHISGYFTQAPMYDYGRETTHYDHCRFWNANPNGRAGILAGAEMTGEEMASDYLAPITSETSYISNKYTQCEWRYLPSGKTATITGVTDANPAVVTTATAHPFVTGETVTLSQMKSAANVIQSASSVITVLSPTSFQMDTLDATGLAGNYTDTGLAARAATKAPVLFSRGSQHVFDACYIVAYGTPSIEWRFVGAGQGNDLIRMDLLVEGAPSSYIHFTGVSTARRIDGLDFSTYNGLPHEGYFTSDSTGDDLTFADSVIRIENHAYTNKLLIPSSPGNFAMRAARVYTPAVSDFNPVLLADFVGLSAATSGNAVWRKSDVLNGAVSATGAFGYLSNVGNGGSVTQATSKATAVTINTRTGLITTAADALAAGASVSFEVNNSAVVGTSAVIAHIGGISTDYTAEIVSVSAGRFSIRLTNITAGSLSQAVSIRFFILDGANT